VGFESGYVVEETNTYALLDIYGSYYKREGVMEFMPHVAIIRYSGVLNTTLRESMGLLGGFQALKAPVLIKPNLCSDVDVTGVATTKVDLVETLIKLVLEEDEDASIRIVESDSESKFADDAFEKLGYNTLAERFQEQGADVALINLSHEPLVTVEFNGLFFKRPQWPKILTMGGTFISLAVAKTHSLTMVTGAMKNLFGVLPRKDQSVYHPSINEVVVDLNRFLTPDLCIVDARTGLEGVLHGRTRKVNTIIAGRKPLSVDAAMARIMGFNPERIRHLVLAERYSLGTLHPHCVGAPLDSTCVPFKTPRNLSATALIK
jgi:uncharacterized protein (DUF362 family)